VFRFCEAGEIAKQFFCNSRACFYFSYVGRGQSDLGRAAQEVGDRDLAVARDLLALGDDLLLYAAVGAHRCRVPRREVGEVSPEHGLYVLAGDDRHLLCAYFQSFDCPHRADDAVDPFGRKGRRSAQSFVFKKYLGYVFQYVFQYGSPRGLQVTERLPRRDHDSRPPCVGVGRGFITQNSNLTLYNRRYAYRRQLGR